MALTEAQKRAHSKYFKNNYKQIALSMPIKEAEQLERHCKEFNYSKAGFLKQAMREKMQRDIEQRDSEQ